MLEPLGPLGFLRGLARLLAGRPQVPRSLHDNALLQTVLGRRSVRSFKPDPIPDDAFSAILEAGRVAPSTVNLQTWTFASFTADTWRGCFGHDLPFGARRAVIIMGDTHRARSLFDAFPESPLVEYTIAVMNASLAAMNMNIAAEALGIGSVMLSETGRTGLLDAGYLAEILALPRGVVPLMTIVFGYPRGMRPPMPPKLPLDTIVTQGMYREADRKTMLSWLEQMMAGYKAGNLGSSFGAQLRLYSAKIAQAEADLKRIAGIDDAQVEAGYSSEGPGSHPTASDHASAAK